ncbi:MAG: hypothetical protein IJ268_03425, partial [Proteobacteria bacterium]|nr:hypothetical protein [Pseudomonadota bacterium]
WGCVDDPVEEPACTVNACNGNISMLCINGTVIPKDCGVAGCNATAGTCNQTVPQQCTVNTCSGSTANLCVGGTIVPQDCGAAGCNAATGTCNSAVQPQCTANTCSGNTANLCVSGKIVPQDCGAAGCNAATGTCNTPTCDTVAVQAQCAAAGKQFNAASCSCIDNTYPDPGDNPVAGASCDSSSYEGGCSSDGTKRYYCGNDGKLVEKSCNSGTSCVVKGNNSSTCESSGEVADCEPGGTVYCNKVCKADGSEGYYYSKGEVHIVTCANNDCTTASGKVECGGGSTPSEPGDNPVAGASCDKNSYEGGCSSDGTKRYYCGNDGKLVEKSCNSGTSCVVKGNNSSICEKSGSPEPGDEPVAGASCDPTTYEGGCKSDGTKRYYCDLNKKVLVEKNCSDGYTCTVNGKNSSSCVKTSCSGAQVTTGGVPDKSCCNVGSYQVSCINGNANALICSGGIVKQWECANSQCSVANNKVTCPNPNGGGSNSCTGSTVTEGGVVGQCCDTENYNPAGCDAYSNSGLRCSNGIIKEWTCKETQKCSYDFAKKWYSCI